MKNKKVLIIIITILASLLIGVGIFFLLPSNDDTKKETKKERDYKTVSETTPGEMGKVGPSKTSFEKIAKDSGFSKVECQDASCIATNNSYPDAEYKDAVTVSEDEKKGISISFVLYFKEKDFTSDNVLKELKTVVSNYYGITTTKEQIETSINGLKNSNEDYYLQTYTEGPNTIEINMQNVVGTNYKIVKYLILNTDLYNLYHNVG